MRAKNSSETLDLLLDGISISYEGIHIWLIHAYI